MYITSTNANVQVQHLLKNYVFLRIETPPLRRNRWNGAGRKTWMDSRPDCAETTDLVAFHLQENSPIAGQRCLRRRYPIGHCCSDADYRVKSLPGPLSQTEAFDYVFRRS